jgi:uncharacterized protein (TIGR00369 family)
MRACREFFVGILGGIEYWKIERNAMIRPEMRGKPALSIGELESFLRHEFPQAFNGTSGLSIEEVWHGGARLRQACRDAFIRPGGTISGPTMMALADVAMYIAVLAAIGPVPLAVTTQLSINFLRRPAAVDLVAEAELLKLGKRLAVGEVAIRSAGGADLVAHATSTYSIPHPQDG